MALVTIKDFGLALNIPQGTIRSKISRNQLCCNRNRIMDTENPKNYSYLLEVNGGDQGVFVSYDLKPTLKSSKKVVSKPKKTTEIPKKSVFKEVSNDKGSVKVASTTETRKNTIIEKLKSEPIKVTPEERKRNKEEKILRDSMLEMERRKKEADVRLVERNAELKQMELEKKAGNTLPLDLVNKILVINLQSILTNFLLETENMVTVTVEELGGNRADVVRITHKLNQIFKKTVEVTKSNTLREIESAVSEYSEVRSRGERK